MGKQINYPTANIYVEENYKIIPKDGVYLIKTLISNMRSNIYATLRNVTKSDSIDVFNFLFLAYYVQELYGSIRKLNWRKKRSNEK